MNIRKIQNVRRRYKFGKSENLVVAYVLNDYECYINTVYQFVIDYEKNYVHIVLILWYFGNVYIFAASVSHHSTGTVSEESITDIKTTNL